MWYQDFNKTELRFICIVREDMEDRIVFFQDTKQGGASYNM
jgi:hypothetical protein